MSPGLSELCSHPSPPWAPPDRQVSRGEVQAKHPKQAEVPTQAMAGRHPGLSHFLICVSVPSWSVCENSRNQTLLYRNIVTADSGRWVRTLSGRAHRWPQDVQDLQNLGLNWNLHERRLSAQGRGTVGWGSGHSVLVVVSAHSHLSSSIWLSPATQLPHNHLLFFHLF